MGGRNRDRVARDGTGLDGTGGINPITMAKNCLIGTLQNFVPKNKHAFKKGL